MTELAKMMFNCTRSMAMLTANMLAHGMDQSAETSAGCCTGQPAPRPPMSMQSMSLMDVLYPANWLRLAAGMLEKLEMAQHPQAPRLPVPSVLDATMQEPETVAVAKPLPSGGRIAAAPESTATAVIARGKITGWGPMP